MVREYFASLDQERLISDFAAAEVASAFARLVRMGLMAETQATIRLDEFDAWRAATSLPVETQPSDVRIAAAYIRRFDLRLRAPDALHLAMVQRVDAALVTLDRRMARAAATLGIAVEIPGTRGDDP